MKKILTVLKMVSIILFSLLAIALTVFLIYMIPERFEKLQTIITAIVSAVYGGLLTLVGVAWTIKYAEKQKREDELAKAKPLFTFNIVANKNFNVNNQKVCLVESDYVPNTLSEAARLPDGIETFFELENSINASFTVKRFYFDSSWHITSVNNIVLPGSKIYIQLYRMDLIEHPIMEIEDIYARKFYYDLMFICIPPFPNVQFCTLGKLKEVTRQELEKRNIAIE